MQTGDRFETNKCGWLTIKDYRNCNEVLVVFDLTEYDTTSTTRNIRKGAVNDKMARSVCGVGFIGDGEHKPSVNSKHTKAYSVWASMLARCYDDAFQDRNPSYIGCSVHPDWHNFQVFAAWHEANYVDGYQLDKDLLIEGNKAYGPDTCTYVAPHLNTLFTDSAAARGEYPIGVSAFQGRFQATISIKGKQAHLGSYATPEEAHDAWKQAKADNAKQMLHLPMDPGMRGRLCEIIIQLESDAEWTGL